MTIANTKIRQQTLDYPRQDVAGDVEGRRGSFEDLIQICCMGFERSKTDSILGLFEWTKDENHHLKKLAWRGSNIEGTLKNRQYRHLTYLFELAYTLAIAPAQNRTNNPTGEWELKYFGD